MDPKILKSIVDGAIQAFQVEAAVVVTLGKSFRKERGDTNYTEFVIGSTIQMDSTDFSGVMALFVSRDLFLSVVSQMVGEEVTEVTDEWEDAPGELLNIIFGQTKAKLNDLGFDFKMAIPEPLRKEGFAKYSEQAASVVVVLPFTTAKGQFRLEVMEFENCSP